MLVSDPKLEQYLEVKFDDDENYYLRLEETDLAPHWNYIGIMWYIMVQGSWVPLPNSLQCNPFEDKYQQCLKQ